MWPFCRSFQEISLLRSNSLLNMATLAINGNAISDSLSDCARFDADAALLSSSKFLQHRNCPKKKLRWKIRLSWYFMIQYLWSQGATGSGRNCCNKGSWKMSRIKDCTWCIQDLKLQSLFNINYEVRTTHSLIVIELVKWSIFAVFISFQPRGKSLPGCLHKCVSSGLKATDSKKQLLSRDISWSMESLIWWIKIYWFMGSFVF